MLGRQQVGVFLDDVAPRRHGDLGAHPEKAQACFDQDGGGKVGCANHHQRPKGVGEHVTPHDAPRTEVQRLGGLDVGLLAKAQKLPSNDARNLHPHGQADGQEDLPESLAKRQGDCQDHEQGGHGPHDLQKPRDDGVGPAAQVACNASQHQSKNQADQDRASTHRKGNGAAGHQPAEHVSAVLVGA